MKTKLALLTFGILISGAAFCQDSSATKPNNKITFRNGGQIHSTIQPAAKTNTNNSIYDTRLGSSSPMYNTYEKNDNGAGAITNDPNKGTSGNSVSLPAVTDSSKHQ